MIIKADVQVPLNSKLCKRHFSKQFLEISCLDFSAGLSELPVKHTHSLDVDARSCGGVLWWPDLKAVDPRGDLRGSGSRWFQAVRR